jgi:2-polyprenyl-3-methyl-5-hydroxy-6-metoxy-1,4-benzoquinol methylase
MMASGAFVAAPDLEHRARQSLGSSDDAIHRMVVSAMDRYGVRGGTLVDVGCGAGALRAAVGTRVDSYIGLDAVRYDRFPTDAAFHALDLDAAEWPLPRGSADVVAAVETIEHLENPWAFTRQLAALTRPGGWVLVTTPNQLSLLSLLTLVTKRRFSAFQDVHFPTHRTALLASDLERASREAGLVPVALEYTHRGRLPLSAAHYPAWLAAALPSALSDNVLLLSKKPG